MRIERARRAARAAAVLPVVLAAGAGPAGGPQGDGAAFASLVWHVETSSGEVVDSRRPDDPVNPASVVKVATTWWALHALGPAHRFETRFEALGRVDASRGVVEGDLVVRGGADPDFQPENAFLVAAALNERGIRTVTGQLVVDGRFWTGWEGGSARATGDPDQRARRMATRLRRDLDPHRWDPATRAVWTRYAGRTGAAPAAPARIEVRGGIRQGVAAEGTPLAVHRSRPLAETLRRFNCSSNNDIERVGASLGEPADLERALAMALAAPDGSVRIATASGLDENRMTPRQVVRLFGLLGREAEREGTVLDALLPVAGCDRGTVTRLYPRLAGAPYAGVLVGKTGTLVKTDGGVSVLAGVLRTARGDLVFCVAAPGSGTRIDAARRETQRWVLDLLARHGGPRPAPCPPPPAASEEGAAVIPAPVRVREGASSPSPPGSARPGGPGGRSR